MEGDIIRCLNGILFHIYKKKIHNHMIFLKGVMYDLWLSKKNMNSAFFLRGGD